MLLKLSIWVFTVKNYHRSQYAECGFGLGFFVWIFFFFFLRDIAFSVEKGLLQPALWGIFYQNLLPWSHLVYLAQEVRSKTVCEDLVTPVLTPCSLQATLGTGSLD